MKKTIWIIIFCGIFLVLVYTQLTIFVVPPIGAIPEGKTIIALRLDKMTFVDSPDAMCERLTGKVSLLCRAMMLATVAKNSTILLRLPYSETLYLISTQGKKYDR